MLENEKCSKCEKEMRKATFDDMNGLIWVDELQAYLCPVCHKYHYRKVIISQ